jgi:hypothetical protein
VPQTSNEIPPRRWKKAVRKSTPSCGGTGGSNLSSSSAESETNPCPNARKNYGAKETSSSSATVKSIGPEDFVGHSGGLAVLRQRQGAGASDDPFKLTNFLKKGGKVIHYHGGSDPRISPFRSTWYYEQLASLHGGYGPTQDSVRLFIVPGMGHCGGGVAPNSFDTLQALHNWVTKGVAPEGIVARATNGRTMPLCKFPEAATYSGSGDVNLAANWTCNAGDTRMLQVGSNGTAAGADTATALQYLYDPIGLNGQ